MEPIKKSRKSQKAKRNVGIEKHLRMNNLIELFGVPRATFYRWIKEDMFPKADAYLGNIPFWKESTVEKALKSKGIDV